MKSKAQKPGRIKSAVLNWLGFGLGDSENWADWYGTTTTSGEVVSAEKALGLSAVWACTRLVSQTISTLPLGLYERKADGSRAAADSLAIAKLIHTKPNADMTSVVFWEAFVANVLLQGNGFAEKRRIGARVVALELMPSDRVTWRRLQSGAYEFVYTASDGKRRVLQEDDVFHVPGFTRDGRFGMSVIKYGAEVFGAGLAANNVANSTFKNGLMQAVYFSMDKTLKPDQRKEFRENLKEVSGSLNAGKSPLLEGGMTANTLGINPSDAQLLESRSYSVEEICRWFGVPPVMVGASDKSSSWASSSEQLNLWFLKYGLTPLLKRIEQSIFDRLLSPAEQRRYYAEFTVEGLLRGDTTARKDFYASALQNGYINRSTVARLENFPDVPGGHIYTVQSNLVPLDQLGSGDQSQVVRAALRHWLGDEENESS